jgi:hypothetical protein
VEFKDLFSAQSSTYVQYRPRYPAALYDAICDLAPGRETAWDCAGGNGQAAADLAAYFGKVVATDASEAQIRNAIGRRGVEYRVAPAEHSGIEDHSVDLTVVAQALHWFDLPAFYREVERVSKPEAIVAAWAYAFFRSEDADLDRAMSRVGTETLADWWRPEPKAIWNGYVGLPFPFRELPMPEFRLEVEWTLEELLGHFASWSAAQRYLEANGKHAAEETFPELLAAWGTPGGKRKLFAPLVLKVGRVV